MYCCRENSDSSVKHQERRCLCPFDGFNRFSESPQSFSTDIRSNNSVWLSEPVINQFGTSVGILFKGAAKRRHVTIALTLVSGSVASNKFIKRNIRDGSHVEYS